MYFRKSSEILKQVVLKKRIRQKRICNKAIEKMYKKCRLSCIVNIRFDELDERILDELEKANYEISEKKKGWRRGRVIIKVAC